MNELLLALAMLCTKTNDLNMAVIEQRKECVVKVMKCIKTTKKHKWDAYIDCIDPNYKKTNK